VDGIIRKRACVDWSNVSVPPRCYQGVAITRMQHGEQRVTPSSDSVRFSLSSLNIALLLEEEAGNGVAAIRDGNRV
jgi:hypothetical protein